MQGEGCQCGGKYQHAGKMPCIPKGFVLLPRRVVVCVAQLARCSILPSLRLHYRRVNVTRANGRRTPELSLSMCQDSFDGS